MQESSEKSPSTNTLSGWVETATPEDAAVLIQTMRDNPNLLNTPFGMAVNAEAVKKVKGTPWEAVLFQQQSLDDERWLDAIRETIEDAEKERERMGENFFRYEGDKMVYQDQAKQK